MVAVSVGDVLSQRVAAAAKVGDASREFLEVPVAVTESSTEGSGINSLSPAADGATGSCVGHLK